MKKIKSVSLVAAMSLLVTGITGLPARADSRISLKPSTGVVFNGSAATVTASSNAYDATSSEWANFKFEIVVSGGMADIVANQMSTNICIGEAGPISSSRRDCTIKAGDGRHVLNAGSTSGDNLYLSRLKITPKYGTSTKYLVRGWVDRNGDDRIDPYEQASVVNRIQGMDANVAKSAIRFHVEPPLIQNTNVKAWVSAASTDSVVGSGGSVSGLIDPALLSVQVVNCQSVPCSTTMISGTWNYNNYQQQHEFTGSQAFSHGAKLTFNLYYNPWADSTLATAIKLASKSYDYTNSWVRSASTSISSSDLIEKIYPAENIHFENQRQSFADANLSSFRYVADLTGADDKPLANQEVYLNIDLHGLSSWSGVKVDDVPLTNVIEDRIQLRRVSDSRGRVEADFSVPEQGDNSQISIDLISGGLRSHEIGGTGKQEVLVWRSDVTRNLVLSFSQNRTGNAEGLRLNAYVRNSEGDLVNGERIVFGSDPALVLSNSLPTLSSGIAYTDIKVGHLADKSGTAQVTAQIVSGKTMTEKKVTVRWEEHGLVMWGYAETVGAPVSKATYVGRHATTTGGQVTGSIGLTTDSYGVKAFEPVTLSLDGPGRLVQSSKLSSKTGAVKFSVKFAPGENGVTALRIYVPRSGFVKTFRLIAGVSATAEIDGDVLRVAVTNAKDSTVVVKIGSQEVYRRTASSDNFAFSARRFETTTKLVSIHVSGVKVFSEYLKF